MDRYTIDVTREGDTWTAAVFAVVDEDGRTGDLLGTGEGETARGAVYELVTSRLNDWED